MKRILSLITAITVAFTAVQAQSPAEDCGSATVFTGAAPWTVVGNSSLALDDYNEECPYSNTGGLDQVIAWNPPTTGFYDLNLCNGTTNFDTKLYIYAGSCPTTGTGTTGTDIACNDDNEESCDNAPIYPPLWTSILRNVFLTAGTTYYIVVDAYDDGTGSEAADDYTLVVINAIAPPTGDDLGITDGRLYDYCFLTEYNLPAADVFTASVDNNGTSSVDATVTMEVYSAADGFTTPIFTDVSAPTAIAPATSGTVLGSTPYILAGDETYAIDFSVTSSGPDGDSSNDTTLAIYVVTPNILGRSEWPFILGPPTNSLVGNNPLTEYGQLLEYDVDFIADTAFFVLSNGTTAFGGGVPGEIITANLYEAVGGDIQNLNLVASGTSPNPGFGQDTVYASFVDLGSTSLPAGDYVLMYQGSNWLGFSGGVFTSGLTDLVRDTAFSGGTVTLAFNSFVWVTELLTREAVASCNSNNVPTNQSNTQLANRFELNWDPTPAAVACQVNGKRLPTGPTPSVNIIGGDISTTNVPFTAAGAGNTYTWRVRCACNISPLDVSAFSPYGDTFTVPLARQGDLVEVDLSMFPNPADNQLVVGMESVAGNANVSVIDMLGRVAIARTENMVDGYNNFTLDVSGLEPGAYFLRLEDGESTRVEEFSVAR